MFGDYISFDQALIVCVFSLAVVFVVLIALAWIVGLTSRIANHFEEKE